MSTTSGTQAEQIELTEAMGESISERNLLIDALAFLDEGEGSAQNARDAIVAAQARRASVYDRMELVVNKLMAHDTDEHGTTTTTATASGSSSLTVDAGVKKRK